MTDIIEQNAITGDNEMSDWIKWKGGECPVPSLSIVHVKLRNGAVCSDTRADELDWNHSGYNYDIVSYKIIEIVKSEIEILKEDLTRIAHEITSENERLKKYRDLVKFIAHDYHELSYEKAQWQRDDWKKRCIKLIEELGI